MEEPSSERAISLEPSCSNRRNPFEDSAEQSSRKRQRISRGGSRSLSADASTDSDTVPDSMPPRGHRNKAEAVEPPSTPTRLPSEPVEPTSRVTINLRTRPLDTIPSSPPSPTTPSKMSHGEADGDTRTSVESESDALSTMPAIETPSTSSSSGSGSPLVELVTNEDDEDDELGDQESAVAIISNDVLHMDPLQSFPYWSDTETLCGTVSKLARFFQYESIDNDDVFFRIHEWIEGVLITHAELDAFAELFQSNPEFWLDLPTLIWGLNHRSKFFGDFLKQPKGRATFSGMICQFARLSGKFVAMDAYILALHNQKSTNDGIPDLGSRPYLCALNFILREEEGAPTHIGTNLNRYYEWEWHRDILAMTDNFQAEGGDVATLTRVVDGKLKLISTEPKIIEDLTDPCKIIVKLVVEAASAPLGSVLMQPCTVDDLGRKIKDGHKFFTIMSAGLANIIEKHLTFLSIDAASAHLYGLTKLCEYILSQKNPISVKIFANQPPALRVLAEGQWPRAVSLEWKFGILKKLIMSSQMQLRVVGVTTMCADLLNIFQAPNLKGRDVTASRFLLYFANFLLRNELIDYLVGIGSHPEIISESWNILGFLVVTRTYTDAQTDKIWQTVMTSQDPRVVEAILKMMSRCFHLYTYESLMYVCKKVMDLPIEKFSLAMREFCTTLFKDICNKAHENAIILLPLAPPPYDILIRLLKLSSATSYDSSARYLETYSFAIGAFKELLTSGPSDEHRNLIYRECISDISAKTAGSAGAISVIMTMIKQNPSVELRKLLMRHGLTQLLVEELELVSMAMGSETSNQAMRNTPSYEACRELLALIIIHEPASISSELGKRLWDVLVGIKTQTMSDRNISWQYLNTALKRTSFNNVFLASCFITHMPTLPAYCFTQGALDFAREAVQASLTELKSGSERDHSFDSAAVEQIWRMVLAAPSNTIDAAAIGILVDTFVNSPLILSMPRAKARTVHLALVNRCLRQLKGAAAKLKSFSGDDSSESDGAMAIVASDEQLLEEENMFARSLAVLREFLRAYLIKPQFATPKSRAPITGVSSDVEGEPLTVKYQSFDGDKHTEVKSLTLGKLNTAASLFATLQKATGFTNYKVYCCGKEFDPDEVDVCKSLEDLKLNGLVLVQRREEAEGLPAHVGSSKPTIEAEITKHFDDLWSYLSMDERVAQEIYYFLKQFPVYAKLTTQFENETSHSVIFPAGQPYKSLYAIHALREYVYQHAQMGAANDSSLSRAIAIIVAAIVDKDVLHCAEELRDHLALQMIKCLNDFLKEPLLATSVTQYLNGGLLQRLLQFLYGAMENQTTQNSPLLVWKSFEAILEASSHSPGLWELFSTHLATTKLLSELVLQEPRQTVRKSVVKQVIARCTFSPSMAQVSSSSFIVAFWPLMTGLIPSAATNIHQSEDTFFLALALFRVLGENSIEYLNLNDLVTQWGTLLLSHSCVESTTFIDSLDTVAHGLTHLLCSAVAFAKASEQPLSCGMIGTNLFRKHMFPALSLDNEDGHVITPVLPLLNASTRHLLTDVIFHLVKEDETEFKALLTALSHLAPYSTHNDIPYSYEMSWQFERSKSIRSSTGYVGLKNLSNTCYLNSLFTQLFMNIPFREFMLSSNVAEGASQKLLTETQNLFGNMQNSLKRYVDPSALAGSIRTYEETPIDVSIQMDVDEFYNLLFDRWESQILAEDAKKKFRSFYGGQLVQQVKSKECPHISERLEPFSAIQCDIKGKSCLQESLQAYVDGEVMEGDNKYKCSTCDQHVDAVKRACLKDIPDNLIFHLKRFDFNIQRMQRSKINDRFTFPTKIDMRPYKVEYLMDDSEEIPEDVFELVGVLIHSGTAESGHYYSFIRERPSSHEDETWVEFNDDCVTPWDPSCMESSCFGGNDYRGPLDGGFNSEKSWSAYMLFYQRSSVVAAQKEMLRKTNLSSPVRLHVPVKLSNHIAMENELLMRRYCLYDPSHAPFVIKMLDNVKNINKGTCDEKHSLERLALTTSLNHLDQIIARAKDLPDFHAFMLSLKQVIFSCAECSRDYLEWYCDSPETIRHLLLRNPESFVRQEIAQSILNALNTVRSELSYAYGFGDDDDNSDDLEGGDPRLIQRLVESISRLWDVFHTNCRAWPEYFGLLSDIGKLGKREASLLLDAGYLLKTLNIVSADSMLHMTPQYQRMFAIISKRMNTTRPVSYESVISLLHTLLRVCDPNVEPIAEDEERLPFAVGGLPIPMTVEERLCLSQHWTKTLAHILTEKLLIINQNQVHTEQIISGLLSWPDNMDEMIRRTIFSNIRRPTNSAPRAPFITAALIYCQESRNPRGLPDMISQITKNVHQSDNGEGGEFLRFFESSFGTQSSYCDLPEEELLRYRLTQVFEWAPCLLTNYESAVRHDTEDFLTDLFLNAHGVVPEDPSSEGNKLLVIAAQKLGIACLDYLNEYYLRQQQQAVRSHFDSIEKVISFCLPFYSSDSKDLLTRRFNETRVMPALKRSMVDEVDEEVSEWDGSDADYDESSEILDGIGDFNGESDNAV